MPGSVSASIIKKTAHDHVFDMADVEEELVRLKTILIDISVDSESNSGRAQFFLCYKTYTFLIKKLQFPYKDVQSGQNVDFEYTSKAFKTCYSYPSVL